MALAIGRVALFLLKRGGAEPVLGLRGIVDDVIRFLFALGAADIAAREVDGGVADRGVGERRVTEVGESGVAPGRAPQADDRLLEDVLGVRMAAGLLPGKQQEPGAVVAEPSFPCIWRA